MSALLVALLLGAGPKEALERAIADTEHLAPPVTVAFPDSGPTTCFAFDRDTFLPLLSQVGAPVAGRLQTEDELLHCAGSRVPKNEACELRACGTFPLGDRVVVMLSVKWRDNLPNPEHFNSRETVFALVFSKAGRLIDTTDVSASLWGTGTIAADGSIRFRTNGGDERDFGRIMPSGRVCKAPVTIEPAMTFRDAKSGETITLARECGSWAISYRAKEGKPLQWMVLKSADEAKGEFVTRFEPSPKPYTLQLDGEQKSLACTNPDKTVQTFVLVP
ncbi:MAG: hypothetical protein JNM69_19870 [Archangium sp.]|nr:hypothetical protein [Archangium sp.]